MQIFVGHEPREQDGYDVTVSSILKHNPGANVTGIYLPLCEQSGLYNRPTTTVNGKLFDIISNASMATEFALTRFLVPWLANSSSKWALFMDCDMLVRCDLSELEDLLDDKYAVMCIKHDIEHGTGEKMDGCKQTSYDRKNWSSVMVWNLEHHANERLTIEMINSLKGRELHQFCWLQDNEIGELPHEWNHLVGLLPENENVKIAHFTLGIPSMPGYEHCEHSEEWKEINNGNNS